MEYHLNGLVIFFSTRRFADHWEASRVWEALSEAVGGKGFDLGIYRHGNQTQKGNLITVLSLYPEGVRAAEVEMRKGRIVDPMDDGDFSSRELDAMILRRAEMISTAPPGARSIEIRREQATQLRDDGTMEDGS